MSRDILLIDDDPIYRMSVASMLANEDYRFIQADSPEDGISALQANPQIRVILLDLSFPDSSGTAFLEHIRAQSGNYRVIILTGHDELLAAERAGDYAVFSYLPKVQQPSRQAVRFSIEQAFKDFHSPVRVFLSYSVNDRPKVLELYNELASRNFAPWMDIKSILPGEVWEYAIRKGIEKADYFVFCLTKDSQRREGVIRKEVRQALEHQGGLLEESIFFIGVRLEPCSVSEPFNRYQYVDLFEPDGLPRLLTALSSGR